MMAVSPEEALEAQEAQKANADANDRGDDFEPSDDVEEEVVSAQRDDDDGATDEPEVEAAATESDEVDEGEEDDGQDQRGPVLIPKHRYDSQAARTRAAEAEIAKLKEQLTERQTSQAEEPPKQDLDADLAAIDAKIADAVADGDKDQVAKLMAESRKMEREYNAQYASSQAQQMSQQAVEKQKLDQTIQMLESEYDFFDPDNDKYNPELVQETLDLHETFMASGKYTPSDAMLQAVGYTLKGAEVSEASPKNVGKRSRTKENIKDSKKQPPDISDTGVDSSKQGKTTEDIDVSRLSMEEFDALPDTTKARLRGDFV